jgi:hypothetical protein
MKSLLFLTLSLSAFAADFEAALSFPKRTENKVFRDRVQANWLPDGKTFWYRVQTAPGKSEFVLIDATNGSRKTAATLKELGLPEKEAAKTSTMKLELRRTRRTGESSGLKFINQLDEDVELYWINQEGEHTRYGGVRAGTEREQHTFEGHVWLITSRTGEHLAVVEGASQAQTFIIDGKGIAKAKTEAPKKPERGFRSPDGSCVVFTEADKVERRKVTIVESTPNDSVQPKLKVIDYIKPGDPLPKPQWVIEKSDGTKIRVPRDLYENPFTESGELDAVWAPDSSEFYFNYNQRGHQLYRILAARLGPVPALQALASDPRAMLHPTLVGEMLAGMASQSEALPGPVAQSARQLLTVWLQGPRTTWDREQAEQTLQVLDHYAAMKTA